MKKVFEIIAVSTLMLIPFGACNNSGSTTANTDKAKTVSEATKPQSETSVPPINIPKVASVSEIINEYLSLKNALTADKTKEAATAAAGLEATIKNYDKSALSTEQKKVFDEVQDDAKEHAEHIGKNGSNIKHQREHFDLLSKDVYTLAKTFGAGQPLYKDFCPMYNDSKGAIWLSETKEINNPYFGKNMPTCGSMKEELK